MPRSRPVERLSVCVRQLHPRPVQGSTDDVDLDALSTAFMASQALMTALEISLFDHLAKGALDAAELGTACGISEPRLQTLLTALVAIKCLRLDSESMKYANSPNVARFMVSSSKDYYGDYIKLQMGRLFYPQMGHLPDVMKGKKVLTYSQWFEDAEVADSYTSAQHNGSVATAKALFRKVDLKGVTSFLDVGGGSGAFSIAAARAVPGLSATVLELPGVCRTGSRIVEKEGFSSRVRYVELDATSTSWPVAPGSFQVVLMSYLSGSVPAETIVSLYTNAYQALQKGGCLIVHDFMVNDTLDGPPLAALWALQHVAVNPLGLGLCASNVTARLSAAGFSHTETNPMIGGLTAVIVGYKS